MLVQWTDHSSQLVSKLNTLLSSHTMLDVTLAAEGRLIKAHKVILAASSKYFEVGKLIWRYGNICVLMDLLLRIY